MPTVGERLATLEQIARDNRADIKSISDLLSGEGNVPYDRSVRGRLHKIESTLAGMVLRRNFGVGLLKGWERITLVLCGAATVAASWYHVVFG
jgi:hypothetical protein